MIQQEVHKLSQVNRFNIASTQRHIHNDIDSPYTFQPILTYVGNISSTGGILLLPIGWSVTYQGTGDYLVTHNLGTQSYVVTATSENLNALIVPTITAFPNSFEITTIASGVGAVDSTFMFSLVNVNNKSDKLPQYGGSLLN